MQRQRKCDLQAFLRETQNIGNNPASGSSYISLADMKSMFITDHMYELHKIIVIIQRLSCPHHNYGNSVCISSQVGCRMGCRFCASTIDGLERNLTVSEMLRQIYHIQKITGERVSNIVVMGTGEPLDNYDNFVKFIHMISDEHGLHISQRNITASTCGIVPNILRLSEEGLQITLALSLHGSNPVSYTHLDVYKRQERRCDHSCRKRP